MSVDGYGTGSGNKAVVNSVTRPLTTLNSGVFALGVAKRPNWEPAELYRKDPVETPMAGLLCDNTRRFLHSPKTDDGFPQLMKRLAATLMDFVR